MKLLMTLLSLCALLFMNVAHAPAQKSTRKSRSPATAICSTVSVPKGMVVVGYRVSATCKAGKELVVKTAENGDIVCAGSPLPRGFYIYAEAQGPMVGSCPSRAFLLSDEKIPAKSSELSPAALEAKCKSEADKEYDRLSKNHMSVDLVYSLTELSRFTCLKSGGKEH